MSGLSIIAQMGLDRIKGPAIFSFDPRPEGLGTNLFSLELCINSRIYLHSIGWKLNGPFGKWIRDGSIIGQSTFGKSHFPVKD